MIERKYRSGDECYTIRGQQIYLDGDKSLLENIAGALFSIRVELEEQTAISTKILGHMRNGA